MVNRERVLELRKLGWTYQQIADDQGCSRQRIYQIVADKAHSPYQISRATQLRRQRMIVATLEKRLAGGKPVTESNQRRWEREVRLDRAFARRTADLARRAFGHV